MILSYLRSIVRNLLGWTAFLLLVLAALYASLGRIVVTNLGDYNTEITDRINAHFQINIAMGDLTGVWSGIDPGIHISDLTIGESEQGPVTRIGKLKIELDSLSSLIRGNPIISYVEISDLNSEIDFYTDQPLRVAGLRLRDKGGGPSALAALLVNTEHLIISGIEAKLKTESGQYLLFQKEDYPLELLAHEGEKTISLRLDYDRVADHQDHEKSGNIELIAEYFGDPRNIDGFYVHAWMHVTPTSIREFLPKAEYRGFSLDKLLVAGDVWLEVDRGRFDLSTQFNAPILSFKSDRTGLDSFEDVSGTFRVTGTGVDEWRAYLNDLTLSHNGKQWTPGNIAAVTYRTVNNRNLLVYCRSLDVGSLADLGIELGKDLIPERQVTMLETMKPQGMLENTYLYLRPDSNKPDFRMVGQLRSGEIEAYLGAPAITNLDFVFSLGPQEGWLDIHDNAFDVAFETISDETWKFQSTAGRLNIDLKQGYLRMASDLLKVRLDDAIVSGKFHLNLTTDRRFQTWGLLVGIKDADLSQKSRYLPSNLSKDARSWLDTALVSGHLKNGGLLFHGSLSRNADAIEKLYELYFDVEDGILDYHPDWPRLESVTGLVNVGNWGVSSDRVVASLFDSQLKADVIMPFAADGGISYVYLNGNLEGAAADGLRFINTTPVAEMINQVSADWTAEGDISGEFKLEIPVNYSLDDSGNPMYNFDGNINTQMLTVDLYMPEYDLAVSGLSSRLDYAVSTGLNADQFHAQILGYPVQGQITTSYEQEANRDEGHILIDFKGRTSVEELREWSEVTFLHLAEGEFDYSASLTTPFGDQVTPGSLQASSDLHGVGIQIPPPLGKLPEETVGFRYRSDFEDDGMKVWIDYNDDFSAALGMRDAVIQRGSLIFGAVGAKLPEDPGVEVSGSLELLNLNDWLRTYDRFTGEFEKLGYASFDEELESEVRRVELDVGRFEFENVSLENAKLGVSRAEQAWNLWLVNPVLSGRATAFDDETSPIDVKVDYLRLISDPDVPEEEDPLAGLTPGDLVPMQVQVDEFRVDDENYGSWNFKLEPGVDQVKITDLYATVKGLEVGHEERGGGVVNWLFDGNQQTSKFSGIVQSDDIAVAATEWGYAPSIEGDRFVFDTDIGWPGSPVMISKETIRGAIRVKSRRGRFVQATGGGALKLLGIFDFAALARRFTFDFSDVLSEGFEFNRIEGEWWVEDGQMRVTEDIIVEGSGGSFKAGGVMDIESGDLDGDMIVTLPVSRNLPWYSAIIVSPMVGATVFLAQKVFQNQINQLSSAKYTVTGTIEEPNIVFESIFDNSVRQEDKPSEASVDDGSEPVQELL
jgi:uncharacterized protein (TIGR02099 family)